MKFSVLLLLANTAYLFTSATQVQKVKFVVEVLKPDLEAIANYYEKIDEKIVAVIHWPYDIDFFVERETHDEEKYLKVIGEFNLKSMGTYTYNNLYYKGGKFYVKANEGMFPMEGTRKLRYKQPKPETFSINKEKYLSIRYRSFDEVKAAIEPFHTKYQQYLETYSAVSPSTYLATWNSPAEDFLEYTTTKCAAAPRKRTVTRLGELAAGLGRFSKPTRQVESPVQLSSLERQKEDVLGAMTEGGLHTLIGKIKKNEVTVTEIGDRYSRLEFNGKDVSIPAASDLNLPTSVENIFAVRMASVGYFTSKRDNNLKMLGTVDLAFSTKGEPWARQIKAASLLSKVAMVEPKSCTSSGNIEECIRLRPTTTKFHVQGCVLTKSVNYLHGGKKINDDCPFVIDYEKKGPSFTIEERTNMERICTDDEKLWTVENKSPIDPSESIILFWG